MSDSKPYIYALISALVCFIVYLMTLNPAVTFMDSGELAAAVATFGIPHPTGYPLFLIIGYLFTILPFGSSVIYKLNLLSAVISAVTVYVTFFVIYEFLHIVSNKSYSKHFNKEERRKRIYERKDRNITSILNEKTSKIKPVIALTFAVLFGLIRTFWQNALSIEVYPLHVLFLSLIILLVLKIYGDIVSGNNKLWMILFLLIGFSFTNHMTTIFIIPAIVYLYYLEYKRNKIHAKGLINKVPILLLPLLLYLVLMIRSASEPYMNWSAPSSLSNLVHHITGGDYSQMMFSAASFSKQLKIFYSEFFAEFAFITAILGLIGLIYLYMLEKKIFTLFFITIIFCLFYSMFYSIRDIQSYFLTAYFLIAVTSSLGFIWLVDVINSQFKLSSKSLLLLIIILCSVAAGFTFNYNYKTNDNSKNYIVEDYTLNALKNLDTNSLVITYDWGYLYPAALYYQQVEHFRQDIKIFNVKFFSVPWYLNIMKKYYPDIYKNIEKEAELYKTNYTSEQNIRSQALMNLIKAFIDKNISKYSIYASYDFTYSNELKPLLTNFSFNSDGLLYKIESKNAFYNSGSGLKSLSQSFRDFIPMTKEADKMKTIIAGIFYDNALYHSNNGNREAALRFIDKSLGIKPDFSFAVNLKNKLLLPKDTLK